MNHPKYRADIDGLRAIAVGAVVVFHAMPNLAPGGFVGVDIFFAITVCFKARSEAACALLRPSASASAKLANNTVNHSHKLI